MDNHTYSRAMTDHQTPRGRGWLRDNPDLAGLAAIALIVSYLHGLEVAHRTGSTGAVAYLIPLVADLLIIGASRALLDAAHYDERRPRLAAVSLVVAIGVTVAMNVAAGWVHGPGGALVSALAPLAFVAAYEILMGRIRRKRQRASGQAKASHERPCPHEFTGDPHQAALTWFVHGRDCLDLSAKVHSQRAITDKWPISRDKLSDLVKAHDAPVLKDSLTTAVQPPSGAQLNGHAPATQQEVGA